MLVIDWRLKIPTIIIQTQKINLLVTVYSVVSQIKSILNIFRFLIYKLALRVVTYGISNRTSMPRITSTVLLIVIILVNCVKFTFSCGAEIIIVAKFVIIWKVTHIYSIIFQVAR